MSDGNSPLAALLGQTSVEQFAAEVWSRRLLVRRSADGDDLTALFTFDDADDLLSGRALRTPFLRVAKDGVVSPGSAFTNSGGVGATINDQVDTEKVTGLLADGSTLVFQGLHRSWPSVQLFVADLISALGHPVQANAYLTPAGSRGFAAHYDTHDVFVVQMGGRKHWTIHPPVVDVAAGLADWNQHKAEVSAVVASAPAFDAVVEPGDVLYVPRGWIHSAQTDESASLHLTLGIHPYTERTVLDEVIASAIAELRLDVSLAAGIDVGDPAAIETVIADVRQRLIDALAATKTDDVATRLSVRRGKDVRVHPLRPLAQVVAADSQRGASSISGILRTGLRPRIDQSGEHASLTVDGGRFEFPASHASALHRVASGSPCDAANLPGLDDSQGRELLRSLFLAGVIVPVQP